MVDMAFGLCGNCFHGESPNQAGEAVCVWLRCSSSRICKCVHTHTHTHARTQTHKHKHTQSPEMCRERRRRKKIHAACLEKRRAKEEDTQTNTRDAASTDVGLVAKCNTWHDANDRCILVTLIANKQREGEKTPEWVTSPPPEEMWELQRILFLWTKQADTVSDLLARSDTFTPLNLWNSRTPFIK